MNGDYSATTDEELAELAKKRDDRAFQELMRRYVRQIFNFVRQYVRNEEDAEDVSQDAFFKTWKYIKRFKRGRQFMPWLYTIARNTALDQIKKKKAVTFSELNDEENNLEFVDTVESKEPWPDSVFASIESAAALSALLDNLHHDYRAVLVLRYHQEMTFDEIATIMGKPMNTVKSWHRRALIHLRDLIAHYPALHQNN